MKAWGCLFPLQGRLTSPSFDLLSLASNRALADISVFDLKFHPRLFCFFPSRHLLSIIGHGFETPLVFENCIPWVRHSSGCLREFFGYIIDYFEKDCLLRILIINV